jgi:uncharacterized phage protein gp47/JayE
MPFDRPTLQQLIDRAEADFDSRLPGGDARLRNSNLNVLARTNAGAAHGLHGHLAWLSDQLMVDTAEAEYLARYAAIWGLSRLAATYASGNVTVTGANGSIIPAGVLLKRADGVEYETSAEATITGGSATVPVVARVAAAAGNTAAGISLSFISPVAGVNAQGVTAAGGLANGTDEEIDDALRERLLDRIRRPPHGGAEFDYEKWAREASSAVTRAWVFPGELGLGTVTVRFMMDDTYDDGVPEPADVTLVQSFIDARRPVTAAVTVVAPVAVPLNLSINLTPNSSAVKAAIEAELRDLLRREAEPGGTILKSHLEEAISIAAGEADHVMTVPNANVTHTTGQIAVLGAITWA